MPDFRLSDDEIARLADFMQEREAPRPIPPLLAGLLVRGAIETSQRGGRSSTSFFDAARATRSSGSLRPARSRLAPRWIASPSV
ncbi:MAG: hypothetical protein U0166_28620 [Acidobacteriota bacterium]